jgi:hypothetical protein
MAAFFSLLNDMKKYCNKRKEDANSNVSFNLNSLIRSYMLNDMNRLKPILVISSFKHWRPKNPTVNFQSQRFTVKL